MGNQMNFRNRELPLMAEIAAPKLLSRGQIEQCQTYRQAVQLCWMQRRIQGMTKRTAAELSGCYAPHMTDYLSPKGNDRRNLPADRIAAFEDVCGNRAITQWLVMSAGMHLAEEMMQKMVA